MSGTITHVVTHATDEWIFGETYLEDGSFFGKWCRQKIHRKSGPPAHGKMAYQERGYSSQAEYERSDEWRRRIRDGRRRWLESLPKREARKEISRLRTEGYDFYGDDYSDMVGESK